MHEVKGIPQGVIPVSIAILVGGFIVVGSQHFSPAHPHGEYGAMLEQHKFNAHAQKVCTRAASAAGHFQLYNPHAISGDGTRYAELVWMPEFASPHAVTCRYEPSQGVTRLVIDNHEITDFSNDIAEDAVHRAADPSAGKHWGHW